MPFFRHTSQGSTIGHSTVFLFGHKRFVWQLYIAALTLQTRKLATVVLNEQNSLWGPMKKRHCRPGLHNSESSKGQIDRHKLAAGRKSLFRGSVEEILKGQVIIRSRAFATFSATEFSRSARKDLAGRMLCRPALEEPETIFIKKGGN